MSSPRANQETLYEIALSIRTEDTLEATAERALSTYLDELDCTAGAVLERRTDSDAGTYEPVSVRPVESSRPDALQTALDQVSTSGDDPDSVRGSLPRSGSGDDGSYYTLVNLPEFGVLALVTTDAPITNELTTSLEPLNEKVANACQRSRVETQLRRERNRFEAVFEAIPEPLVNVTLSGGDPVVERVNAAFEDTFGYEQQEIVGRDLNELIVPEGETRQDGRQIDDYPSGRESVTKEIRRRTADGVRDFLFRSAPLSGATDGTEQFGMYVDITDRKERERKLEQLYEATQDALVADDPVVICERAVTAAAEILDLSVAGIHRHDRSSEALVPVATTSEVAALLAGSPDPYTDQETFVWEVYRSGEPTVIDDIEQIDGPVPGDETPARSALVFPLGTFGVFIVSSVEPDAFDASDFYFARLLSTMVTTGLNRAEREQGLEAIQQITRASLDVETKRAVAEEAISRIPSALDLPLSAIWQYDDTEQALRPLASTDTARELFDEIPTFTGGDSIVWRTFQTGETNVVQKVGSRSDAYNPQSPIASEILVSIGDFGVLSTGSTTKENFTQSDRYLLETLAANLETAFELVERQQDLQLLDQVLSRVLRHNIRNDLLVIKSRAKHLEDVGADTTAEAVGEIIAKCDDLEATAEYAREMRDVVARRGQSTTMSLLEVVAETVTDLRADYPDAEIGTAVETDAEVTAHVDFPMAVRHLVENSIEHYEPSGTGGDATPHVEVSVVERDGAVVLEVADDGPGIPDHEIEVLDQHGETALKHGSGIGLWIVDRVVDYSGATIDFESSPAGTTARISFE